MAWIEKRQGVSDEGESFGYVGESRNNGGGYFFTWKSTLEDTIASIEVDEVVHPKVLTKRGAAKIIRAAWRYEQQHKEDS